MRGEYPKTIWDKHFDEELPPHARRIQMGLAPTEETGGTTSACAENTQVAQFAFRLEGNYLRMRGEYAARSFITNSTSELPPHARRIQSYDDFIRHLEGTTSACAENTSMMVSCTRLIRNYLRMRGEYPPYDKQNTVFLELPPHARRILYTPQTPRLGNGTTSACAENTLVVELTKSWERNYLRMRGEYELEKLVVAASEELPPHARRIPEALTAAHMTPGTTSACAENTNRPADL